ncbi:hypothetical protein DPX16_23695 [Anabarilius grahami]|uniref:Uncharacterized protein n=1 Tax=Anabarilius grahami TaxID=495550 RepID=A0A3N0Z3M7_ANAGA|nr:hypothetical protein DPX16_23695 [Anabarilius grahami]
MHQLLASQHGNPHPSCTLQPVELPGERSGPPQRCVPSVSFGAPQDDSMSIAASEGEPETSGDDESAQLPPSGVTSVPDTDPEMMAMLARAANRVGLAWNPPPCSEPSRLDDWYLGVARAGSQPPTPVPFFPEVHEELTGSWTAPFTASHPAATPAPAPQQQPPPKRRRGAGRGRGAQPVQAPAKKGGKAKSKRP